MKPGRESKDEEKTKEEEEKGEENEADCMKEGKDETKEGRLVAGLGALNIPASTLLLVGHIHT